MLDAGDVIVADIPGVTGVKRRPGVVVSSATYHAHRPDAIIGILTSNVAAATSPTDYLLVDCQAASLTKPTAFRTFLVPLPRRQCRVIGRLAQSDWEAVHACTLQAIDNG